MSDDAIKIIFLEEWAKWFESPKEKCACVVAAQTQRIDRPIPAFRCVVTIRQKTAKI